MQKYIKKVIYLFFVMLIISLCACTKEQPKETETVEIKIIENQHSLLFLPLYLSCELEFFKRQGLEVFVETATTQENALKSMLSEEAPFLIGTPESAFFHLQQNKEKPLILIAQTASKSGCFLIERKSAKPFEWQNLKGKSVLGYSNGELPEILFEYLLKKNSLRPFLDVHIVQNLPSRLFEGSFLAGTGNYLLAAEPLATRIEKASDGILAVSLDTAADPLVTAVILTTPEYLEKNPVISQNFVRGLEQGLNWVNEHTPEEITEIGRKFFPEEEMVLLRAISRYKTLGVWPDTAKIDLEGIKNLQEILAEKKELDSDLILEQLKYSNLIP